MSIPKQIEEYISNQPETKRKDMLDLHRIILEEMPGCRLWFLDGMNHENKVVSNPNIGYGHRIIRYADGTTKDFYQIGMSANTTGISVYILGIEDKKYLAQAFAKTIGKASITGYCIKFRSLSNIHIDILRKAIQYGLSNPLAD